MSRQDRSILCSESLSVACSFCAHGNVRAAGQARWRVLWHPYGLCDACCLDPTADAVG